MKVKYASALVKVYESVEVVAKSEFVCPFNTIYVINVPLLLNNGVLVCTILMCLVAWYYK